jgi:tetratricopeptide (TPR) repeat protein
VDAALKQKRTPGFLYQDAALAVHAKDLAGARKSIEAGLEMAPADPFGWKLLGEAMEAQGQLPAFVGKLKEVVAKNPASLEKLLGERFVQTGDLTGARAAFEASRAAGEAEADRDLAVLDVRAGSVDSAERRMLELVKTHDSAAARLMLGDIALRKGSPDSAIKHYTQALKLEPANPAVMNNLAEMLAIKGRYDDALFWAQKALALSPGNPTVLDTIGWTYYRQGKFEPALEYLDKALRGRERPLAHYHFAAGLLKAGDPARAKAEYAIALKQDPQSPARTEVAQLFEGSIPKVSH